MKKTAFKAVAIGVSLMTAPVFGADLPVAYTKAPAFSPPVYDWTGFYAGVFGGGGYGNHNLNNARGPTGAANFTVNYSSQGAMGGGELGYNWQSGRFLFGIEGDYAWGRHQG